MTHLDADLPLATRHVGREIRTYDEVDSTNSVAAGWIAEGAPHGAVVIAEFQTRGRGRMGRSWTSRRGLNLTFSVVLRPELSPDRLGMLTVASCTAVARALDRFADPLVSAIKWPNDVYLNDRKVCGMLLEASWTAPRRNPAVVLGIGINVNQDDFPEDVRNRATSLLLETGRVVPRRDLLARVLTELEASIDRLQTDEAAVREEYAGRMMSVDERIVLRFAGSDDTVAGVVIGVDDSGGIILATDAGTRVFHAGEVTHATKHPHN